MRAMKRKKILAYFLNCSNRNLGKNVNTLYLAVLMQGEKKQNEISMKQIIHCNQGYVIQCSSSQSKAVVPKLGSTIPLMVIGRFKPLVRNKQVEWDIRII